MASILTKEQIKDAEKDKKENEEKQKKIEEIEDSEKIYGFTGGVPDDAEPKKC